ncbi:MAG: citrate/2-methylcitrate synthase [Gammaproteobacteria bacterium]|nr:citrate/2-methylcitrate synthase [Gammaproteobacteria bacterium]
MKSKIDLIKSEENWQTDLGGSIPGERVVVRGRDLFSELKDFSWLKLLLFMITGREFEDNAVELLDKIWALTISYPDPRVWNNRIGALAGTARSTGSLGVGAGAAVSEAKIYGGQANIAAIDFIKECSEKVDAGEKLEDLIKTELKTNRAIYGYGRPIANGDERIQPIKELMVKNGFDNGKHVQLANEVEKFLMSGRWRLQMNITGLAAAIGADMGFSVKEYYLYAVNGFNAGITACFADASSKDEGTLFPLRCNRIDYDGIENRKWS